MIVLVKKACLTKYKKCAVIGHCQKIRQQLLFWKILREEITLYIFLCRIMFIDPSSSYYSRAYIHNILPPRVQTVFRITVFGRKLVILGYFCTFYVEIRKTDKKAGV